MKVLPAIARFVFLTAGCLVAAVLVPLANGQPSIQTVISNGPTATRFNIAILSEGYTAGQLGAFRTQADNIVSALLDRPPLAEYRAFFNAFAISVASSQSGSDHPAGGISVSTYFNSSYDLADRIVTIPSTSQGQGRVDALIQSLLPVCNLSIVLVNDMVPAGSDGAGKTAVVSVGTSIESVSDILAHEVGHVMAGLGDEYDAAYPGYPDTEEPNTTRETRRDFIKWKSWISPNTPVPTPPSLEYSDAVGLFEGAHYHPTGWYRPRLNCGMRDNFSPFCEVCAQALILALHARDRFVDSYAPAATNLLISTDQTLLFSVNLVRPATHQLTPQWFTNGVAVPGAPSDSLYLPPALLRDGSNSVSVLVSDNTSLVRDDPNGLLRQTNSWTVTVSIPRLRLEYPVWLQGGKFAFRVAGTAPNGFVLASSTNMAYWNPLSTNFLVNGQLWYTNSALNGSPRTYYRTLVR